LLQGIALFLTVTHFRSERRQRLALKAGA